MFDIQKSIATSVTKGKIVGFNQHGAIIIEPENSSTTVSCYCLRTGQGPFPKFALNDLVAITVQEKGQEGYILGLIEPYLTCTGEEASESSSHNEYLHFEKHSKTVTINGNFIRLQAAEETTIVCGKSTICLNRDGRVTIRGEKLISRSSGSNKIKGASVMIN
jgi:hypothetical protein